ncbi:hypothetical protein CVT25_008603 [Psilocybe cyanescens]|uniref:Uncharacterized protein n=1 Tax=Psilocybe cyanescens TaxID=93625 RepID=A0A409XLF4_PSICY|nr:hypothetical protein CVT25_008603 [Psilocybe cyanescens]
MFLPILDPKLTGHRKIRPSSSVPPGTSTTSSAGAAGGRGSGVNARDKRMSYSEKDQEYQDEASTAPLPLTSTTAPTHHTLPPNFPNTFLPLLSALRLIHKHVLHPLTMLLLSIHAFLTVPLYIALLSPIVALTPLQYALEHNSALRPANGVVETCGKRVVPVTLVVLGGIFGGAEEGKDADNKDGEKKRDRNGNMLCVTDLLHIGTHLNTKQTRSGQGDEPGRNPGETKTVLLMISARMLLMLLTTLATKSNWHAIFEECFFFFFFSVLHVVRCESGVYAPLTLSFLFHFFWCSITRLSSSFDRHVFIGL